MKKTLIVTAVLLLTGAIGNAAHVWEDAGGWWDSHFVQAKGPRFTANELSMDLFASYMANETKIEHIFKTDIREGDWGGGVGLNYFFTREIGIGADVNMPADGGNFVDSVDGNLIARLPIESAGLAPYIFGGGGRWTDQSWEWFWQAGVGLEVRLNPMTGIFIDGRYMWLQGQLPDKLLLRAGIRLVF